MSELKRTSSLFSTDSGIAVVACGFAIDPIEFNVSLVRLNARLGVGMRLNADISCPWHGNGSFTFVRSKLE